MIKKIFLKKVVPVCLLVCMASSIMVSAQPNIENNFDTTTDSIDAIFANANRIEETTEGTLYYFDELEGMVLKVSNDDTDTTILIVKEEGYKDNIVEIDKDNHVYLNGKPVIVTCEKLQSENESTVEPLLTTRYYESDSGNPSLYTVLGKTEKVANIYFESTIGGVV